MGLRFDKVDPRLWAELGTKVGTAYVQNKAGDANAKGMKQSTQTTSNYGKVDPNAVYTGEGADGIMTAAEAASYGINIPVEDKVAGTGVIQQYGLGLNPQKFQDAEFTPEQQRIGGLKSQAAFYAARGDTDRSNKILSQVQQSDLTDMQLSQAKRQGVREDKVDAYETSRQEAFNGSVFGQQNATYAKQFQDYTSAKGKYDAGIAAGQSPQTLGLPPQQPARVAYSLADSLADQGAFLANDAKHGKVDAKTFGAFAENMRKIEDEGYLKALNLAQGGGSIDDVAKAFNSSGQVKFDPKSVLSDKMVPGQGGVPERVITFKDENGNTQTLNVMAQLKSLGKANEALSQFYAGETNRRGNAGEVRADRADARAGQSLGIQQAQLGLSQRSHNDKRTDAAALRSAGVAYETARQTGDDAGMRAATLKLIEAGGTAPGGANANDPSEVKLAHAYIRAGLAGNLAEGLQLATSSKDSSPDKVRAEIYGKALAASFGNAGKAKIATEEAMTYLFPSGSKPSRSAPGKANGQAGPTPAIGPTKGAVMDGYEFQGGDPKDKNSWRQVKGEGDNSTPAPATPVAIPATPTVASPAKNFYGADAIAQRKAKDAAKVAAENQADAAQVAQRQADFSERMRQWRMTNETGAAPLNALYQGRP